MLMPGVKVFDNDRNSYEIIEMIGNGGFGFVYKIQKELTGSYYALKTLPSDFANQMEYDTFFNECEIALKISHTNVLNYIYVYKGNENNSLPPYLIMELANQGTLMKYIEEQKKQNSFFPIEILKNFFVQLVEGMKHINKYIVHRDIKADNILINDGVLKIADFGISKIANAKTRPLTFKGIGHIKYMAPERWKKEHNTIQSDIYSTGILFYELATLKHPYNVENDSDMSAWQDAHNFQTPQPLKLINTELPNGIIQVINKMIEKDTKARYKNWDEIEKDLQIDELPTTPLSSSINHLVNLRISKDESIKTEYLRKEKELLEKTEYKKRINYQFIHNIYTPLKDLVDEFNIRYSGNKFKLDSFNNLTADYIDFNLKTPSNTIINIRLKPLYDKDFFKLREDRFDERRYQSLERPTLQNRLVLAWGYFSVQNDQGFNILLVEEQEHTYGKWYLMYNFINSLREKPANIVEPFAIDFSELEETLAHMSVLGRKFDNEIVDIEQLIPSISNILNKHI